MLRSHLWRRSLSTVGASRRRLLDRASANNRVSSFSGQRTFSSQTDRQCQSFGGTDSTFTRHSTAAATSLFLPTWMLAKLPKGFEDFFPEDSKKPPPDNTAKENESSQTETEDSSKTTSRLETSTHQKDDNHKQQHTPPPPPSDNDSGNLPGLIILLALVIALREFMDAEQKSRGLEISFVHFRNEFLWKNKVEKLQVINKNMARVILKKDAFQETPDEVVEWNTGNNSSNNGMTVTNQNNNKSPHFFFYIGSVESFEEKLTKAQAHVHPSEWVEVEYMTRTNVATEALRLLPFLAFMAAFYLGSRGMMGLPGQTGAGGSGGGMNNIFSVGRTNAKKFSKEDVQVSFNDVAGCQEAKKEIMEFVDFLKDAERFTKLGAKIPKGALLCGPPGTGKTLLAKAVAGEAGVPFYTVSGSDFIEMFVGVGPSRVRDLFSEARQNAPCIVFIDEIDAVGRQRGRAGVGGNDERENTLNQLLVEMDGFTPSTGVIVLAGTNRVDILDQALTRPGRFDRQITVDKPDLQGRKAIFKVHLQGIKLEDDDDDIAGRLAGLTPGFAGADIANICNEAAIVAARRKGETVTLEDFEKATDRIIGGLESNKIMSKEERSIVAHHEAGHAVAGWFLEHADPLLKVTIIPRTSGALGFAQYLPKEVFLRTQEQIMDIVCMALAGRASEEIFFGHVTTGAYDDLKRVTELVYSTIQLYGMNSRLGQLSFPRDPNALFEDRPYSEKTAKAMDEEARMIVDDAYKRTLELLRDKKEQVETVAKLLLEKETITHDDVVECIGPRPFKGDPAYEEFLARKKDMKKQEHYTEKEKRDDEHGPEKEDNLNPGLA